MDTWGIYGIIAGALIWWLLKKKTLGLCVMCFSAGFTIAAWMAYAIVLTTLR